MTSSFGEPHSRAARDDRDHHINGFASPRREDHDDAAAERPREREAERHADADVRVAVAHLRRCHQDGARRASGEGLHVSSCHQDGARRVSGEEIPRGARRHGRACGRWMGPRVAVSRAL